MAKCSFCSRQIEPGTGMMIIRNDGKILRFDSSKCEKSMMKLGRDPRDITWIKKMKQ
jgi:large subunit ribosomal protein L24e